MPTTSPSSPLLPALRPASGTTTASADATTVSSSQEMRVNIEFDEDWHRLPSDIVFFQDLLLSLEAKRHGGAAASFSPAAASGGPFYTSAVQRDKDLEERDIAALRVRERQLAIIERRRLRSRRRCDAVDEAFHNALKRRWQAMQHLAADPPAERLVGQGMTQYVPAALLPDDVVDGRGRRQPGPLPLVPQSAVELRMQNLSPAPAITGEGPASAVGAKALTGCPSGMAAEQEAIVFLTQLDPGGGPAAKAEAVARSHERTPSCAVLSQATALAGGNDKRAGEWVPSPPTLEHTASTTLTEASGRAYADEQGDSADDQAVGMRPKTVTEANKARWHEMGYRVVVVGREGRGGGAGTQEAEMVRRAVRSASTSSKEGVSPWTAERCPAVFSGSMRRQRPSDRRTTHTSRSGWDWMQLAPLPPMCLVQRRLPEEDMTITELRERHERRILVASAASSVPRGRKSRRGGSWGMIRKSAPH
ncbi:hypothetical protein LSCM1_04345 [Leishmania martiniquensis]|uniref:Uncharacterized protein n=1 Tax=Leishmania martiniquensis TaxID=1580590 RepID=A0A836GXH7_9TRYP|nr:hypothetical protein LSCM1_04345 [Leishmania martiniquensis]